MKKTEKINYVKKPLPSGQPAKTVVVEGLVKSPADPAKKLEGEIKGGTK